MHKFLEFSLHTAGPFYYRTPAAQLTSGKLAGGVMGPRRQYRYSASKPLCYWEPTTI